MPGTLVFILLTARVLTTLNSESLIHGRRT